MKRKTGKHNRRRFLRAAGGAAAAALSGFGRAAEAGPRAEILETRIISHEAGYYCGWPTVTRTRGGQLFLVYSGGREGHVCPFGRVEIMDSKDNGKSWSWPRVLLDSAIDDRDAGILETARGTLLVTTFTSLAYEGILQKAQAKRPEDPDAWAPDRLKAWQLAHERLSAAQRQAELGQWIIRSPDGGISWSARTPCPLNSPHGPIQLADGRLLYAGKELWAGDGRVGVCESSDDGRSWAWLAEIPPRQGDSVKNYHELHAVQCADDRIIVHIRNQNQADSLETLQSESSDGGRTWSAPRSIGVWGLPSFLLRFRNGHLLMSYGYRRAPFGNQARLSRDLGVTWSEPMTISEDGVSGDLGYPSTVQLEDGTLLTIWYELMRNSRRAVLRQAHWILEI